MTRARHPESRPAHLPVLRLGIAHAEDDCLSADGPSISLHNSLEMLFYHVLYNWRVYYAYAHGFLQRRVWCDGWYSLCRLWSPGGGAGPAAVRQCHLAPADSSGRPAGEDG